MDKNAERHARQAALSRPLSSGRRPTPPNYDLVVRGLTAAELDRELVSVRDSTPRSIAAGYVEAIEEEARRRGVA